MGDQALADTDGGGRQSGPEPDDQPAEPGEPTSQRDDADRLGPRFGPFQPAIDRWAATVGRPAPDTLDGRRVHPRFVEWMMGLPEGWVTDHIAGSHALRVLGNGVVPQQAASAYGELIPEAPVKPAISKPDLGGGVSHPARFSIEMIEEFAQLLRRHEAGPRLLDPFAGTGRIHGLRALGWDTVGVELEREWADMSPYTIQGDATKLPFADESFDVIATSPCYGNRMADSYNASDPHLRRSYRFDLGRELSPNNSGAMRWGAEYRALHTKAWREAARVLRPGGLFLLNVKDHIRNGARQYVAGWHVSALICEDMDLLEHHEVASRMLRQGTNQDARLPENIYVLRKIT